MRALPSAEVSYAAWERKGVPDSTANPGAWRGAEASRRVSECGEKRVAFGAVDMALITRALVQTFLAEHVSAVADNARATALARDLDPAALSGALVLEAQARMAAGDLNEAQARLSEAERTGEPVDASSMRYLDTLRGDLATASGRPADALEPYARSLELAQARGDALQVLFDLRGLANAAALIGRDADALELLGIAEMQAKEIGPFRRR